MKTLLLSSIRFTRTPPTRHLVIKVTSGLENKVSIYNKKFLLENLVFFVKKPIHNQLLLINKYTVYIKSSILNILDLRGDWE